jgi:hypothetical protein
VATNEITTANVDEYIEKRIKKAGSEQEDLDADIALNPIAVWKIQVRSSSLSPRVGSRALPRVRLDHVPRSIRAATVIARRDASNVTWI